MDVRLVDDDDEKVFVFEESLYIDFDYEFDVAKYFDFTQLETPEEIKEAELWFDLAQGHPPSPLLIDWAMEADDSVDSVTSSPRYGLHKAYSVDNDSGGSEVSSFMQGRKGSQMLKSKLKSTSQANFPVGSRLLQPTASLLAKKNQHVDVCSTRVSRRLLSLNTKQNFHTSHLKRLEPLIRTLLMLSKKLLFQKNQTWQRHIEH